MSPSKVLIVEDERIVQMHLRRIVSNLGHDVVGTASNTREAIEAAEHVSPDLVLMDIHLSEESDGVDTAKALCDRFDCAVVFVTAFADAETIERSGPVAAAGYLVKPFSDAEVRAAISTALAGHGRLRRAQQRERSLASILVTMGDAIFVTDECGTISFANPSAIDITGSAANDTCDRDLLEVLRFSAASDEHAVRQAMLRSLAEARPESLPQLEIVTGDGSERVVGIDIEPVLERGEQPSGLIVMLRDRSPRRRPPRPVAATSREPFGAGTRLLVYSHDTFGLGHLRRNLNIIRALLARHPGMSALLVTGSPMVHRYPMPTGADYLKLPAVRKVASERYEARSLSMSDRGILTLRSNLLLRTIRDYDPNVLLADHSPVGMKGELRPSLEWLQQQGTCTRILGLRDIIDEPSEVIALWREQGIYDVLRELYDHVVIYGSREIYDPVRLYGFPEDIAAKTRFVQYVCDHSEPEEGPAPSDEGGLPLVAVSVGGGDGGADAVIGSFLDMLQRFRPRIDFRAEILTGPFVPEELDRRFRERARDLPVVIKDFVPSIAPLYRSAELVVSTAGYNTVTDLLSHARRAILIPRILHRQEQLIRARRLEELGLVTCLRPDEVTPERLFEAIQGARASGEPLTRGRETAVVPLRGAEGFSDFCGKLLVASRAT